MPIFYAKNKYISTFYQWKNIQKNVKKIKSKKSDEKCDIGNRDGVVIKLYQQEKVLLISKINNNFFN